MYYTIKEDKYWYEKHGKIGPQVVLLHGFTGSSKTWGNFITAWQGQFQFITIDLPGHGNTKVSNVKTMKECCDDIKALINHLGISQFHLIGYSMGGRTALSFVMYYPELVQSLILESASPGLSSNVERKERMKKDEQLAAKLVNEGIESFVDFWENVPLFNSQKELPLNIKSAIREERLAQSPNGLAKSLKGMGTGSQPSWWKELTNIELPTLLLVGELDEKFVQLNKKMAECLPHAHFEMVNKTGHALHVEQPEIFGKIVTEFILDKHELE
ncbi:2-succinyl-6-hydroxy-2,4-cyclohexadiene-1-carboxylate synthase [Virgibacillus sp. SK37]|uniref:2-succinyl-6-hydroxy-2, 4-cyclohexadiene-1-carboxylate synthase n=1 Tax=Virgibacillus sp. SK37 TaxID=403957 RepID=UPI0004D0D80B|nr:2-succinyl-6-hydroxy-2,4-cyclohexadiene-1-carboxylate synthase [Virgibacillus sp. SK37]AIF43998.1 esterase [Virgibacillus sp. SK37]